MDTTTTSLINRSDGYLSPAQLCTVLLALLLSVCANSQETYSYRVFLDNDLNASTGCTYEMGNTGNSNVLAGFESYLELTMLAPGEINQYSITGEIVSCISGVWDIANSQAIASASWAATLDPNPSQADSIEGFIPRSVLDYSTQARVVVQSENNAVEQFDTLENSAGQPIYLTVFGENIPTLSNLTIVVLLLLMAYIGLRGNRYRAPIGGVVLCMSIGSTLYVTDATSVVNDHCAVWGWCADWSGETPSAFDASGDTSDPAIDLQSLYLAQAANGDIAVRIDVDDVSNACASLSPCNTNALCSNEPTGYSCACNEGFFGDGFSCASGGSVLSAPLQSALYGTLIPVSCVDGDCNCPVGFSGPGVIIVYSYAYSGVCTQVDVPNNSTCSNGTCACDSGYVSDSILGDPLWNAVTQSYDGNCTLPVNAVYDAAFFDVPTYQFAPELTSGEFGVTTWQ